MKPVETFIVGAYRVEIHNDPDPVNPREHFDHMGTMVCHHGRYRLGDKHDYKTPRDFMASKEFTDAAVKLPMYMYDHSGLTVSTEPFSCPWDSGQIGFIVVSKKKIRDTYHIKTITKKKLEMVTRILKEEVEEYDQYLRGAVYGYKVIRIADAVEVDSCWGIYGYDYAVEEARSSAELSEAA